MFALIPALALLVPVLAQDSNNASNGSVSSVQIEGLEANFKQAQLSPQLFEDFDPEAILSVSFGGNAISTGDKLEQSAVSSAPDISVSPESNSTIEGDKFTLIMVDANPVGTDESTEAQTRHWLVNGVSINQGSSAPYALSFDGATTITDYAGPGPAEGSGSHRYVIALYEQPSSFAAPANLSQAGTALGTMFLSSYVSESGLGDLVSAQYFQVENGQATASAEATTSVDSTTLEGYFSTTVASATSGANSQTSAGSASGSAAATSGSGTGSAAASASSAASTTGSGGSSGAGRTGVTWGVVVGGLGVVGAVVGAAL
ncbi:nuclear protein [Kwoniella heveanensis CBS 569]|nr:nuclear protein [Kwoniella heveanensis CBS 569]